jgi:hypothetical protein
MGVAPCRRSPALFRAQPIRSEDPMNRMSRTPGADGAPLVPEEPAPLGNGETPRPSPFDDTVPIVIPPPPPRPRRR